MANMCSFNLRAFGTCEQLDEVAQYVKSRIKRSGDRLYIDGDEWWAELYAKDVESVCQQTDDALEINGESKDVPGLHLARELSEKFPDLKIHIGGSDEEGHGELWELIGGEGRLLGRDGLLTFWELGFGVGYWLVRDGQVVSSEQRQAAIAEQIACFEVGQMEDFGIEYTAEQKEQREAVIQRAIEQLEQRIEREAERSAILAESATSGHNKPTPEADVMEEFIAALELMEEEDRKHKMSGTRSDI